MHTPMTMVLIFLLLGGTLYSLESNVTYEFKYVGSVDDANHVKMGKFKFKNLSASAIELPGFGFIDVKGTYAESGRVFRVRFEQFSVNASGTWEILPVVYCGTGAQDYKIEPNIEYEFHVPLSVFRGKEGKGMVKLATGKVVY
jgi:hypothetical protein